jgi:AcrR family transcriptional regulator
MNDKKRANLITIGHRLFSEYGYRDVNIEDVAKAAGISTGSFYSYFESKEDFYGQVLDVIETDGAKRLEKIISYLHSPINKLRVTYRFVTLGVRHNPMLRGVLANDEKYIYPGTEERRNRGDDIRSRVQKILAEILREGSAKGLFRSGVYRNPSYLLTALYDVILYHLDSKKFDDLLEDILVLLSRGLRRQIQLRNKEKRVDRRYLRRTGIDLENIDFDDEEQDDLFEET